MRSGISWGDDLGGVVDYASKPLGTEHGLHFRGKDATV